MAYIDLLRDGRWQVRKTEIMKRDNFKCQNCGAEASKGATLNVHHIRYRRGAMPWEYNDDELITLCEACHKNTHEKINKKREKVKQDKYSIKVGDMLMYEHSDYTNYGIVYDVDFKAMTAKLASIDNGADLDKFYIDIVRIMEDGSLITKSHYPVCREISDIDDFSEGSIYVHIAENIRFIMGGCYQKDQNRYLYDGDLSEENAECSIIRKNFDTMLENNDALRNYFVTNYGL